MDKVARAEVFKTVESYLAAFNASDMDTINSIIAFPCTYIGNGIVKTLDSFPIRPSDLKKINSWDRSECFEVDIVAVSETKAHVLMRNARRVRVDGSLIEEASGFYAFKKTDDGWKMFAISDVTMPA